MNRFVIIVRILLIFLQLYLLFLGTANLDWYHIPSYLEQHARENYLLNSTKLKMCCIEVNGKYIPKTLYDW